MSCGKPRYPTNDFFHGALNGGPPTMHTTVEYPQLCNPHNFVTMLSRFGHAEIHLCSSCVNGSQCQVPTRYHGVTTFVLGCLDNAGLASNGLTCKVLISHLKVSCLISVTNQLSHLPLHPTPSASPSPEEHSFCLAIPQSSPVTLSYNPPLTMTP